MVEEFERSVMHMALVKSTNGAAFNGSTEHIYKRHIQRRTCVKRISDLEANCHAVSAHAIGGQPIVAGCTSIRNLGLNRSSFHSFSHSVSHDCDTWAASLRSNGTTNSLCELSLRCCSSFSSRLETSPKAASDSGDQAEQPARKHHEATRMSTQLAVASNGRLESSRRCT